MKNLISKYVQSVCTPEEFREVSQWIVQNTNKQLPGWQFAPAWEASLKEGPIKENPRLWQKIKYAIEEEEKAAARRTLSRYTWALRIAAVLVIGLLATNLFTLTFTTSQAEKSIAQTITVPNGARTSISLPDGSKAWINSGSNLSFPSIFTGSRELFLEGEAYFEVLKSDKPFIVATHNGTVRVTGTAFNVSAYPDDYQFVTTLDKGSVVVSHKYSQKSLELKPGEQSRVAAGRLVAAPVQTDLFTSWKEGKIIFRREFLPDVAKRLERWYNVKIVLADDPRLRNIYYTGTLEMESFSEVMELLKKTASIDYTFDEKARIIRIDYRKTKNH